MKAIAAILGSLLLGSVQLWPSCAAAQAAPDGPVLFGFAVVTECGTRGASAPRRTPAGLVCLRDTIFVPPADVASAKVVEIEPAYGIVVEFASASARRILELSTANVGRRMAILIDGEMVHTGPVSAPFGHDLQISRLTRPQAEGLVRRIKGNAGR